MTDETTENDFASFEASVADGTINEPEKADETVEEKTDEKDDTLELTDKADEADDDESGDDKPKRSKPAHQRIAEITAARRTAERERDEALARLAALEKGEQPQSTERPDPNDEKYEWGEDDPQYREDMIAWTVEERLKARDEKQKQTAQQEALTTELSSLDASWNEAVEKASEKYEDFNAVVIEGADKWECPPMVAIGLQTSEVGTDVAYELAKNPVKAASISATLAIDLVRAAEEFGELEGAHLESLPKRPNSNHPMDLARYAGQVRAFANKPARDAANRVTRAPEPPRHSIRGSGGQYEVGADTTDFAAFEKKAMGKR